MKRLFLSEGKKIWKSKFNIVLLILLFAFTGYRIYNAYAQAGRSLEEVDYVYKDIDGNEIEGVDYYQFADKIHHRYAGTLQASTIDAMNTDFAKIRSEYTQTIPDTQYMSYKYGENYEIFLENAKSGVYDFNEFQEALEGKKINGYSSEGVDNSSKIKAYFPYYYEEDRVLSLYYKIYANHYAFKSTRMNDSPIPYDQYFDTLGKRLESKETSGNGFVYPIAGLEQDVIDYYNQKAKDTSYEYDSVIGNTAFVNALQSIEFTSILVLILILANTFAMERHHKIDQIMVPTTMGWRKITMAKLGSAIALALGIVCIQVGMAFVFSCIIIPMRSLDLAYIGQSDVFAYNIEQFIFSYKEIIGTAIIMMSLATIATSVVTCCLSYITKSRFLTVIPLLLIVLLTGSMGFFEVFIQEGGFVIDSFMPAQMVHFNRYFQIRESMSNIVSFGSQLIELRYVVILFWTCAIAGFVFVMYFVSKHHTIKSS